MEENSLLDDDREYDFIVVVVTIFYPILCSVSCFELMFQFNASMLLLYYDYVQFFYLSIIFVRSKSRWESYRCAVVFVFVFEKC